MSAGIAAVMGSRAFHIRSIGRDRVQNFHLDICSGVVSVDDVVGQNVAGFHLHTVDVGGAFLYKHFLVRHLVGEGIDKEHICRCQGCRLGGFSGGGIGDGRLQLAVAVIADAHHKGVLGAVVYDALHGIGGILHDSKVVGAGVTEFAGELELAVHILFLINQLHCAVGNLKGMVGNVELEGKGIVLQNLAVEVLLSIEYHLGICRGVGIHEGNFFILHIRAGAEIAALVRYINGYGDGSIRAVIDNTRHIAFHLFDGIGVLASFRIGNGIKAEAAVCLIGNGLQQDIAFIQLEAEFVGSGGTAIEDLVAAESILGGVCLIGVDKCDEAVGSGVVADLIHGCIGNH